MGSGSMLRFRRPRLLLLVQGSDGDDEDDEDAAAAVAVLQAPCAVRYLSRGEKVEDADSGGCCWEVV